jgi:hypothetical protein
VLCCLSPDRKDCAADGRGAFGGGRLHVQDHLFSAEEWISDDLARAQRHLLLIGHDENVDDENLDCRGEGRCVFCLFPGSEGGFVLLLSWVR